MNGANTQARVRAAEQPSRAPELTIKISQLGDRVALPPRTGELANGEYNRESGNHNQQE